MRCQRKSHNIRQMKYKMVQYNRYQKGTEASAAVHSGPCYPEVLQDVPEKNIMQSTLDQFIDFPTGQQNARSLRPGNERAWK